MIFFSFYHVYLRIMFMERRKAQQNMFHLAFMEKWHYYIESIYNLV